MFKEITENLNAAVQENYTSETGAGCFLFLPSTSTHKATCAHTLHTNIPTAPHMPNSFWILSQDSGGDFGMLVLRLDYAPDPCVCVLDWYQIFAIKRLGDEGNLIRTSCFGGNNVAAVLIFSGNA